MCPAELHAIRDLRAWDLPWIAVAQPLVRDLLLPAVADDLIENAELVADAVANGRHFDRRERIHVTRRKPPESAIAETGLLLLRKDLVEIVAEPAQGLARWLGDAEIEQVVREMRAGQILRGEISDATGVRAAIVFHALDSALEEAVADGQGERDVEIVFRRDGLKPAHPAAEVVAECLLDFISAETSSDIFG